MARNAKFINYRGIIMEAILRNYVIVMVSSTHFQSVNKQINSLPAFNMNRLARVQRAGNVCAVNAAVYTTKGESGTDDTTKTLAGNET